MMHTGFEVIHPSASQLIVVAHPTYWLALVAIVIILIGAAVGIQGLRQAKYSNVGLGTILILSGVFFCSMALSRGTVIFDKTAGTVTFDRVGLFFFARHVTFPLSEVRRATVRAMGNGSDHFVVVFTDGGVEDLVASTSDPGQYRAADAVNEFLGVSQ